MLLFIQELDAVKQRLLWHTPILLPFSTTPLQTVFLEITTRAIKSIVVRHIETRLERQIAAIFTNSNSAFVSYSISFALNRSEALTFSSNTD